MITKRLDRRFQSLSQRSAQQRRQEPVGKSRKIAMIGIDSANFGIVRSNLALLPNFARVLTESEQQGYRRLRPYLAESRSAYRTALGWSEAKRPGPLIRKEPLLGVPFDRNTGLSLQTLGGEADALPPCTDAFHDCGSEQGERHQMAHIAFADTFSGCDLLGRHRSSRRQFAEPLVPPGQCSK